MSVYVKKLVAQAKENSFKLANLSTVQKNKVLKAMAKALLDGREFILKENQKDILLARKNNKKQSFIDRLTLNDARIKEMSVSLKQVAQLVDPVGGVFYENTMANGAKVQKVRVPLGVVLIVYEARPNVTSDCIALLFKTSNLGILRGGRDAYNSNSAITTVLYRALRDSGIDFKPFFLVDKLDHRTVAELLKQDAYIDIVIPRGGESLIRKVVKSSTIPVIKHYKGVCHIFVDSTADLKKALKICINAKVQRPSVCNAVETILVHEEVASKFLPLLEKVFDIYGVQIRGDNKTHKLLKNSKLANKSDWSAEYLDLIVAIKVVKSVDQAIEHINTYGSRHTESILTRNKVNANKFLKEVDSACCFLNISTRFSDGYQFGLGAEIGISTDKLHARGPMGLEELTTYKWIVKGTGQIRT
ncbi:MAG: glutamate-5-semialdehyde dehydrogenase [Candidatus Omnitrophica bacterium]|nr:glutamate-5-semialdehyde dehydrogenase [Candidatus Omnitrophota bacterium]